MAALEVLALLPAVPYAALEHHAGGKEEERGDADEVDHVACVDDAAADALVVVHDADALDHEVGAAEEPHVVDGLEAEVDDGAEDGGDDEGDNLVVGEGAAEEADGDEGAAEEQETDVGAHDAAGVDVADGVAQRHDAEVAHQRGEEGDEDECPGGEEFGPDDGPVTEAAGEEQLEGAGALLFGEGAHGDGGDEEEVEEGSYEEHAVHAGISVVEDVEIAVEYPEHQAGEDEEHGDGEVTGE